MKDINKYIQSRNNELLLHLMQHFKSDRHRNKYRTIVNRHTASIKESYRLGIERAEELMFDENKIVNPAEYCKRLQAKIKKLEK